MFFLRNKTEIEFHKNEKDQINALTLYQGGAVMKAMKKYLKEIFYQNSNSYKGNQNSGCLF